MGSVSDIDRCAELVPDELIIFFDVIISRVVVPSRVRPFFPTVFFEVLKSVPHRQWVFSIPKRMRIYFMYDRKLLSALSRCAWRVLSVYLRQPQFKYRVKTVVSRRHFAVGDHVEPDKSELRFRNEFYGFDVNVRVDTPMILDTLLFGFEFEFDGT
jgi:hypothetical protein